MTGVVDFRTVQRAFADHLRNPATAPAPAGIEDRRLAIYRDLVYRNVESFLANGFPVLKSLTPEADWHGMVRDFLRQHRSDSPYFADIGREFLHFLQTERAEPGDPPFLVELAHYEWVELALDIARESVPANGPKGPNLLTDHLMLSPLAWPLGYRFPVHLIGRNYQPREAPAETTFLVVYRNRQDKVCFMESNAVTHRLLALLDGSGQRVDQALSTIARELHHARPEALHDAGFEIVARLRDLDILCHAGS